MEIKSPSKRGTTKPNTSKLTKSKSKSKTSNNKKHPLKVVYISNPMKVTTSASDFMTLVQRLTGKSAVWPVDGSEIKSPTASDFSDSQTAPNSCNGIVTNNASVTDCGVEYSPVADPSPESSVASDDLLFQKLDPDYDDVILIDFGPSMFRSDGVDLFGY